jgi:hypothetical protein
MRASRMILVAAMTLSQSPLAIAAGEGSADPSFCYLGDQRYSAGMEFCVSKNWTLKCVAKLGETMAHWQLDGDSDRREGCKDLPAPWQPKVIAPWRPE